MQAEGPEILASDALWAEHQLNIYNGMLSTVEALAAFGVQKVRETLSPSESAGINWDLANQQAADWARAHAEERSRLISQSTRDKIAKARGKLEDVYGEVATWIEQPEAMGDLVNRITAIVGDPVRAEAIAVTEATATFADANTNAWAQAGYEPAVVKPAYHVRCRCYTQPYKLSDGTKVIVSYTARDELVCKNTPIEVPWQSKPMEGCRSMHTRVISGGDYSGMKLSDAIREAQRNA